MTYRGRVANGTVVLDEPAELPEGSRVDVSVSELLAYEEDEKPIWQVAVEMGASIPLEEWEKMPTDASKNLDHYLDGAPKRDE